MNGDHEYQEEIKEEAEVSSLPEKKNLFTRVASLLDYIEIFALSVLTVLLVFTVFFRMCKVDGSSMNNTLKDG